MPNCNPRDRFFDQHLTLMKYSYILAHQIEQSDFTLCKKFVILHRLSYTGPRLVTLHWLYRTSRNFVVKQLHKKRQNDISYNQDG